MFSLDMLDRKEEIRAGLKGPYVVIENALIEEKAEQLYEELLKTDAWEKVKVLHGGFHSLRDNIPLHHPNIPPLLKEFYTYLMSEETRQWFTDLCDKRCDSFVGAATDFSKGDHISEHNDRFIYDEPGKPRYARSLTFNYYLTRQWNPEWGGNFIWKQPEKRIPPTFNTLILFALTRSSDHWVEPVTVDPQARRISITGWYVGELQNQTLSLSI